MGYIWSKRLFWVHQHLLPLPNNIQSGDPNWRSTWLITDSERDLSVEGVDTYPRQLLYSWPYSQFRSINYRWVFLQKGHKQPICFGMAKLF